MGVCCVNSKLHSSHGRLTNSSRQGIDKRERQTQQMEAKRRRIENGEEVTLPIYATEFTKEEIDGEERRPKKKVAVLIGYSGTGYSGMQLYVCTFSSRYALSLTMGLGTRTSAPLKATYSLPLSRLAQSQKLMQPIPRSPPSSAVRAQIRECMLPEMLSL